MWFGLFAGCASISVAFGALPLTRSLANTGSRLVPWREQATLASSAIISTSSHPNHHSLSPFTLFQLSLPLVHPIRNPGTTVQICRNTWIVATLASGVSLPSVATSHLQLQPHLYLFHRRLPNGVNACFNCLLNTCALDLHVEAAYQPS